MWRHVRGSAPGSDELLFTEDDERFNVGMSKTRSGRRGAPQAPGGSPRAPDVTPWVGDSTAPPLGDAEHEAAGSAARASLHRRRFIVIGSDSSETSEVWLLDLQSPSAGLRCGRSPFCSV